MRALENVKLKVEDKEIECPALFDTGSGYSAVQRKFFEECFGHRWIKLPGP